MKSKRKHSSKKPNYRQVSNSDITDDETTEYDGGLSNVEVATDKAAPVAEEKPKDKTFCQYLFDNPLSKGPLIYFIVGVIATAANGVFYIMDNDTGYVIAGILGASLCFYGLKHFYTLLGLKKEVDYFTKLNRKFHHERTMLSKEVGRITNARMDLRETSNRLRIANAQNRENLENFREIQANMDSFGKQSLEELADLQQRSNLIETKWRDQLYEHERQLLHTVFERMERQGSRLGMNRNEFKEFENQLPDAYRVRFDRLGTFHKLAHGGSLIRYQDFKMGLDLFAEMNADDVDIEFEIRETRRPKSARSSRKVKQVKFRPRLQSLSEAEDISVDTSMISASSFSPVDKGPQSMHMLTPLTAESSVDLEDVEFDEEDEDEDAPPLYDRKVVVTKRTIRGRKFREGLAENLFVESDEDEYDYDEDATFGDMFGKRESVESIGAGAPGLGGKHHFKVTDQKVGLKSLGARKFGNLLDDTDD